MPGKDSALFSVSRHQIGYSAFFRYDLPRNVRRQIAALDPGVALGDHEGVRRILARYAPCDTVSQGRGTPLRGVPLRPSSLTLCIAMDVM